MKSIGRNIRSSWSGERPTPSPEKQSVGFHTGIVMDDQDDQRMGRIWVYIPAFSATRFDENSTPNYGGTTPDRQSGRISFDEKLRLGWVLCYPMLPFFGGDDYRVNRGPDGRDSKKGDTNAYGFWYQPRIGDNVGVLFDNADPNKAFWIGCIPKQYRNFAVPGSAGVPKSELDDPATSFGPQDGSRDTSPRPLKDIAPDDALIPALDRATTRDNPTREGKFPANALGRNLIGAGLICDPLRGASTGTARRESPSYVTGIKSPGWNYDSEKFNKDVDGRQFEERQSELRTHNAMGHQLVMDDHPDYQAIRLRTSYGSQLYMNDSCENPFIYITTAKGKVWIELVDDGNINVYGDGSFSLHAKQDINLTADRDFNVEAFGNMNMLIHGEQRMEVLKRTDWAFGADGAQPHFVYDYGSVDHTIDGSLQESIGQNHDTRVLGTRAEDVGADYGQNVGGVHVSNNGGDRFMQAGGNYAEQATNIFMNSGLSSSPVQPEQAEPPRFPVPKEKFGPPTLDQIINCEQPSKRKYVASVVPQHQPWPLRCGAGNTFGSNGYVGARSSTLPGATPPPAQNNTCARSGESMNYRRGAPDPAAAQPINFAGQRNGQAEPGIYVGQPYQGSSRAEQPQWKLARALRIGESATPDSFDVSDDMLDFIKQQETFQASPKLDQDGNLIIGFGHLIKVGDVIGGVDVTSDLLNQLRKTAGTFEGALTTTLEEATSFLTNELSEVTSFLRDSLPDQELTQGQFDALASAARNVGVDTLRNTPEGQRVTQMLRDGCYEQATETLMPFVHVEGFVSCDHVDRRRAEVQDRYGEIPDQDGVAVQAASFDPGTDAIEVGDWRIDPDVKAAIDLAAATHGIPPEYMYAMAAQESGFNPNARASTSSAKGLYQFIDATGAQYGLDESNVFDPIANADAAARFYKDNAEALSAGALGGAEPGPTDLYLAHFLGAGSVSRGSGANGFISQLQSNPNGTPATDPNFSAAAGANRSVFFDGQGNPRTYQQVFDYFDRRMTRRVAQFEPITTATTV